MRLYILQYLILDGNVKDVGRTIWSEVGAISGLRTLAVR